MANVPSLCGVVVMYHPDAGIVANLSAMIRECGRVFVVDNGASVETRARLATLPGLEMIGLGQNIGVAAALNAGGRRACAEGCKWMVTFDQDSRPRAGMVDALLATATRNPAAAVVAPRIFEPAGPAGGYRWLRPHPRVPWLFQRRGVEAGDLPAVTAAITSGSLVSLPVWEQVGGFDERLFIDYVDIEYCLRIGREGGVVAVAAAAGLDHSLGARQSAVVLGQDFRPMHHPALRHYYMARNRVIVWRRHAAAVPHWALFDAIFAAYNTVRVLAFEGEKRAKLRAMRLGLVDGWKGRHGPCPEERRRRLQHLAPQREQATE